MSQFVEMGEEHEECLTQIEDKMNQEALRAHLKERVNLSPEVMTHYTDAYLRVTNVKYEHGLQRISCGPSDLEPDYRWLCEACTKRRLQSAPREGATAEDAPEESLPASCCCTLQ